jgi:hypothetical protein
METVDFTGGKQRKPKKKAAGKRKRADQPETTLNSSSNAEHNNASPAQQQSQQQSDDKQASQQRSDDKNAHADGLADMLAASYTDPDTGEMDWDSYQRDLDQQHSTNPESAESKDSKVCIIFVFLLEAGCWHRLSLPLNSVAMTMMMIQTPSAAQSSRCMQGQLTRSTHRVLRLRSARHCVVTSCAC